MNNKSEDSDLDKILDSEADSETIERLYTQIHSVPNLIGKARQIDQYLLGHFQEIRYSTEILIDQFNTQKQTILQKFDGHLMPIAKQVLDDLIHDADNLQLDLDQVLIDPDASVEKDWIDYAKKWVQLYEKWRDRKEIKNRVLNILSDRTSSLIEKDIKVIKEYQDQSIANVPKESEEFKDLENRLSQATSDSMKKLVALKKVFSPTSTLKEASEWVARLHQQRESYFDQVLMKIDTLVREVVSFDENENEEIFKEIAEEMLFVEHELIHINDLLKHIDHIDEEEILFLKERLVGLVEHLEQFDLTHIPKKLKKRLDHIQSQITKAMGSIDGR